MSESITDLRKICQETKRGDHYKKKDQLIERLIRKVSIYITKLLLKTSISANQVSVLNAFVGIAGGTFLIFSSPKFWIIGVLLLYLTLILDGVDGEIARYRGTASAAGKYLDDISGTFVWMYVLACASWGIYHALHSNIVFIFGFSSIIFLFLYQYPIPVPNLSEDEKEALVTRYSPPRLLKYGRLFFGWGSQGLFHGILVASIIDCFIPIFIIATFSVNFRFIYLVIYTIVLLGGAVVKILSVLGKGIKAQNF